MTAPKQVWVNECDYTQCTDQPAITGLRYISDDAPELLALVDLVRTERAYWVALAEKDWAKQDAMEAAVDYPILRTMTEAMRKADKFTDALMKWDALQ